MAKILLKPKKEVVADAVIQAAALEIKALWQSYDSGKIKYIAYSESLDRTYQKYKVSKESFEQGLSNLLLNGKIS